MFESIFFLFFIFIYICEATENYGRYDNCIWINKLKNNEQFSIHFIIIQQTWPSINKICIYNLF